LAIKIGEYAPSLHETSLWSTTINSDIKKVRGTHPELATLAPKRSGFPETFSGESFRPAKTFAGEIISSAKVF